MASPTIQIPESVYPPIPGENHRYYGNIHKKQVILHSAANVQAIGNTSSFPQFFDMDMDIYEAAATGNIDRVKELLDPRGAGETTSSFLLANEVSSSSGLNPLHYAASRGHTDIVKLLVTEAGAIIDLEDQTASYNGHVSIVAWLIKNSANIEQQDNDGWTALHNASSQGHLLIVKYLIENADANVDVKSNKGHTPLMNAASKGHLSVVKYLLNRANANPLVKNCIGESAYDIAAASQKAYICELLEKTEREWWKHKRLLQSTTSPDDLMNLPATNQPYDVYGFHSAIPVILHENQRLSSAFSLTIRNPPKYSANNLLKNDSCSPWSLHPDGKPCTKEDVQLPPGPSSSSTSSKNSQSDWEWFTNWCIDIDYPRIDSQGWQYAKKFDEPDSNWSESLPSNSNVGVRRRRWIRIMKRKMNLTEIGIDELDYLEKAEAIARKYPDNSKGKSVDHSSADKLAKYKEAIEILSSGIRTDHNAQRKQKAMYLINNFTQVAELQGNDIQTTPNMPKPLSPTPLSYRSDATLTNNETPSTASFETIEQPFYDEDAHNLQESIIDLTTHSTLVSPRTHPQTSVNMTNAQAQTLTSHNKFKWENDEDVSECRLCDKKFRLWARRHHCRRCGKVVCDQCSTKRVHLSPEQVLSDPSSSDIMIKPVGKNL
ncbi:2563_t:CDS:2 [Dentiscutata erythropus]|uniref:2563_t:CDS:1 n=1 Tax=Dentiscutata erythropus TaxID=1348616 RepID=A0A9N8ZNE3_9GLOM|nr:2563_t:CDS:2 [Dentiscutata erythropus]